MIRSINHSMISLPGRASYAHPLRLAAPNRDLSAVAGSFRVAAQRQQGAEEKFAQALALGARKKIFQVVDSRAMAVEFRPSVAPGVELLGPSTTISLESVAQRFAHLREFPRLADSPGDLLGTLGHLIEVAAQQRHRSEAVLSMWDRSGALPEWVDEQQVQGFMTRGTELNRILGAWSALISAQLK